MGTEIAFIIALAVAVAATFWLILRSASDKIITQYRIISEKLNLEVTIPESKLLGFVRNEPASYGIYRGRELSLSVPGKGLQNTRQIETVLKIELKNPDLRAQFTAAGIIGRFKQRDSGGMTRWQSGDASFDQAIDVRSNHGQQLKAILGKKALNWLRRSLKNSKGSLYIGNGTLVYTELGLISNEAVRQRFEEMIEFLCDLAETVEA
ncbi:hypothetical protein QEH59_13950 [Coraliomargarita sp. SDUM461004]|uniref:Uncharacterized protein n=1 Tax=Thalassobacterium sedimentorum TaxID=3041258 RepID=A0ABU1AP34_9BACT|nr:hypothetical protein [Coraliomargarita sp. SDUM461004]MDQ8195531.1 hypothetical protein [Coraliomargarita sp. SDUM461004]